MNEIVERKEQEIIDAIVFIHGNPRSMVWEDTLGLVLAQRGLFAHRGAASQAIARAVQAGVLVRVGRHVQISRRRLRH